MEEEKQKYLEEDKDILNEVSVLEDAKDGSHQGQIQRLGYLQIKSILRSRKTTEDSNNNTEKYSKVIIFLTFVLILIGILQLIIPEFNAGFNIDNLYNLIVKAVLILLTFWIFIPKITKEVMDYKPK